MGRRGRKRKRNRGKLRQQKRNQPDSLDKAFELLDGDKQLSRRQKKKLRAQQRDASDRHTSKNKKNNTHYKKKGKIIRMEVLPSLPFVEGVKSALPGTVVQVNG